VPRHLTGGVDLDRRRHGRAADVTRKTRAAKHGECNLAAIGVLRLAIRFNEKKYVGFL
jgi:hypothetical protein